MFKMKRTEKTEAQTDAEKAIKKQDKKDLKAELKTFIKAEIVTRDVELSDLWKYAKDKYPHKFTDSDVVELAYEILDDFNKAEAEALAAKKK